MQIFIKKISLPTSTINPATAQYISHHHFPMALTKYYIIFGKFTYRAFCEMPEKFMAVKILRHFSSKKFNASLS
jgi:hypothetical protein